MLIRARFVVKEGGMWVVRWRSTVCVHAGFGVGGVVCAVCVSLLCLPVIILYNLAVKGWPWPCVDSVWGGEVGGSGLMGGVRDEALMSWCAGGWASSLLADRTNGRPACPVSGANHCLLVSFPLLSELLSRTAPRRRQNGGVDGVCGGKVRQRGEESQGSNRQLWKFWDFADGRF